MRALTLAWIALIAAVPLVSASWGSSWLAPLEPNTHHDGGPFGWVDPGNGGAAQIYLDLVYTPTSIYQATPHYEALLGVWVDCNNDGIMGNVLGETYSAVLLPDASICPPGSRHHDGQTVTELLWIGPGLAWPHIHDPNAAVWMDALVPGETPIGTKGYVDDELQMDPSGPRWVGSTLFVIEPDHATGYARVGGATLAFTHTPSGGASFVYGTPDCPAIPGPITNGWQCDPTPWSTTARVGDLYHLRDVDCSVPC